MKQVVLRGKHNQHFRYLIARFSILWQWWSNTLNSKMKTNDRENIIPINPNLIFRSYWQTTDILKEIHKLSKYSLASCSFGRMNWNCMIFDCYIRVYWFFNFYWYGTANFWLGSPLATPLKQGTQLIIKILVYLCDHTCQLECSKQYSMIESYRFVFTSAHYPFPLMKQTYLKLLQK